MQDVGRGDIARFGTGKLKELCKLLPEESEVSAEQRSQVTGHGDGQHVEQVHLCCAAGAAAAVVQWEPLPVDRGRQVHGAAGQGAGVSPDRFCQI